MKSIVLFKSLALIAVVGVASSIAEAAEARGRVDRRQTRQAARVQNGIQSGEITAAEAHRLQVSKRMIRRNERRAEADGTVTATEQKRLENMQDARSQQINRLKHNDLERSAEPKQ